MMMMTYVPTCFNQL